MATKRKIQWYKGNSNSLNEIYQQTGLIFSFVTAPKNGLAQCHPWVKCRDYLHDAVRTTITGIPSHIYGFKFDKTNPLVDLRRMRMLVSKHNMEGPEEITQFKNKMKAGLVLLNHFEKVAKVGLSAVKDVEHEGSGKNHVVMFTGSLMWVRSPQLVSMYTFLIRLGDKELSFTSSADLTKQLGELADSGKADNDVTYLKSSWNKLHEVVKNRKTLFPMQDGVHDIYYMEHNINSFHNQGGILSLCKAETPDMALNKRVKKTIHTKEHQGGN